VGVSNDLTLKPKPKFDLQNLDNWQAHVHHQAPNLILNVVNMKTKEIVLVGWMFCVQVDTTDHHSHSTY
jgi:hypothetical protein